MDSGTLHRRQWEGRAAHKAGLGRSRGGFTSKIHARADGQGRPLGFVLTGSEASDYKAIDDLIALPVAKPRLMLADKGYDGDDIRASHPRRAAPSQQSCEYGGQRRGAGRCRLLLIVLALVCEVVRAPSSSATPWTIAFVATLVGGFIVMGLTMQ
ncbi:hypothetical protein GGR20_000891 [Devosia subaequoris]|uniref:Transposase IS4-like domain-containing protein n=1 Tax=Devosia subaequoris TaxID=395930 RepID=A0A7W6IKD7_9HYPH|nr:hypothetical protein [Devosia subaequoris]